MTKEMFEQIRKATVLAGTAGLLAFGLSATPAFAQKVKDKSQNGGDAQAIVDEMKEACLKLVRNESALTDFLDDNVYTYDTYTKGNEPYYQELDATRTVGEDGELTLWGFIEQYPNHEMGYCQANYYGSLDVSVDLVAADPDMVGETEADENGEYGSFQMGGDNPLLLIHAYRNETAFTYQFTQLIPD